MTANITVKSTGPVSKTMTQQQVFDKMESERTGGRKKMVWFTEDQVDLMKQLRAFETDLSDSKIIRKAMALYLRMHQVRTGQSKKKSA